MVSLFILIATGVFIAVILNRVWLATGDAFHPAFFFGIPMLGMYVAQPLWLIMSDYDGLLQFHNETRLAIITAVNGLGIVAIMLGVIGPRNAIIPPQAIDITQRNQRLFFLSMVLGIMAVGCYLFTIYVVGGFYAAYGRHYGGGWSRLGYVREAYWISIPALTLLAMSRRKLKLVDYGLAITYAMPLLVHGLLGGRRGPTAAAIITLWLARSIATGRRPSVVKLFIGMGLLATLLLFLVANRSAIQLGGTKKLDKGLKSYATEVGSSNEFIYGGAVVLTSTKQGVHYFGRRYLTVVFIRPIPRQLFPSKYAFAAQYLKIPNLAQKGSNLGTGNLDFVGMVGWRPAVGAAPGLIADLWLEFSVGYVISLWLVGRFYWFGWHRMKLGNRFWVIAYTVMASLSIYLTTQTLEAMLFRFLLASGAVVGVWYIAEHRLPRFELMLRRPRRRR